MEDYLSHARAIHATVRMIQEGLIREFGAARPGMEEGCAELTLAQYNTLMAIREQGESSVKQLAERLNVSPPSVSSMVDRLVEAGHLERMPNPSDRRAVIIRLTQAGLETLQFMESECLGFIVGLMEELGDEEVRRWRATYDKLHSILIKRREACVGASMKGSIP